MNHSQPRRSSDNDTSALKLVLITNGLRPVLDWFVDLPVSTIGIIAWKGDSGSSFASKLTSKPSVSRLYAAMRSRQYASLQHYCQLNSLQYAASSKHNPLELQRVLKQWAPDLVLSSGCPFIPMDVLKDVPLGGINLHPSALPAYRGADPLIWQVLDQAEHVGASVHVLTDQYDMGAVLAQKKILRTPGINRNALIHQLEGELGPLLVKEAIKRLTIDTHSTGYEQPDDSPTSMARRLNIHSVGEVRPLSSCSSRLAWDIVSFYGVCPPAWLNKTGRQAFLSWKPVKVEFTDSTTAEKVTPWRIVDTALTVKLLSDSAIITLRPGKPL